MEMIQHAPAPSAPAIPQVTTENVQPPQGAPTPQPTQPNGAQQTPGQAPAGEPTGDKPTDPSQSAAPKEGEPNPDDGPLSARFAALSKREREIVTREKKAQEMSKKYEPIAQALSNFKSDPASALLAMEEEGVTFEMLAQAYINKKDPNHKPSEEDKYKTLKEEIDSIKAEKAEAEKKAQEAQVEKEITTFKNKIKSFVEAGGDKYELIQAQNAIDAVYDVIELHYADTKEIMSIDAASDRVENYLFEEGKRLLAIKKFGHSPTPPPAAPEVPKAPPTAAQAIAQGRQPSPTLSASETPAPSYETPHGYLPRDESIKRVASKLRWKE